MKRNFPLTVLPAGFLMVASSCLSSCDDCNQPQKQYDPPLTGSEKAFSPYEQGQVIQFRNEAGTLFPVAVTAKATTQKIGSASLDNKDPCGDYIRYIEALETSIEGNLDSSGTTLTGFSV